MSANRKKQVSTITVRGRVQIRASQTTLFPTVIGLHPTLPAVQSSVALSGGVKLASISDVYQYFRFTEIRLRCLGNSSDGSAQLIAGYQPDASIANSATYADAVDLPWTTHIIQTNTTNNTVPSVPPVEVIPSLTLLDENIRWWRTRVSGSVDDQFEYQGLLTFGSTISGGVALWDLEYTCEFRAFEVASLTPSIVSMRDLQARQALELIASGDPVPGAAGQPAISARTLTATTSGVRGGGPVRRPV